MAVQGLWVRVHLRKTPDVPVLDNSEGWDHGPAGWCAQKETESALCLQQFHCRLSPGYVDTGAEPGRSRMISREEFARQLQLSDPQTVAGAFSFFQKVTELGCRAQGSGFKDGIWVATSVSLDGQFGICTGYSNSCCQSRLLRSAGESFFFF